MALSFDEVQELFNTLGVQSFGAALPEGRIHWTNADGETVAHGRCQAVLSWAAANDSIMWADHIPHFGKAGVPCLPAPDPDQPYEEGIDIEQAITRADFEGWIEPDVNRIAAAVDRLLAKTGASAKDVDRVFMTGGTSLVPAVRRAFDERFGADRVVLGDRFTSVTAGLAAARRLQRLASFASVPPRSLQDTYPGNRPATRWTWALWAGDQSSSAPELMSCQATSCSLAR